MKIEEKEQLRSDALNVPMALMKENLEKLNRCSGINKTQLLSIYYFYRDLEIKLRILSPDFNLALNEVNRKKATIELCLRANWGNDAEYFLQ